MKMIYIVGEGFVLFC